MRKIAEPLTRASTLAGFADLVRQFGADPAVLLKQAKLLPRVLIEPDLQISSRRFNQLVELAAKVCGCEDFGLRLAAKHSLGTLGPIGMLAREDATVGDAMKTLIHYLYLHANVAVLDLHRGEGVAIITITMRAFDGEPVRQSREMMTGAAVRVLRSFLGDGWNPLSVSFSHTAPQKADFHRRFFRCRVEFEQPITAVLFNLGDLDREIAPANPEFQRYVRRWVDALEAQGKSTETLVDDVRRLIRLLLAAGKCSADRLAEYLRLDRRTVHRKLQAHGTSFSDLLNEVRRELAEDAVTASHRSLSEIADMLGFSHLSGFSRWYVAEFGMSPSLTRKNRQAGRESVRAPKI